MHTHIKNSIKLHDLFFWWDIEMFFEFYVEKFEEAWADKHMCKKSLRVDRLLPVSWVTLAILAR
jgi:hypothetical protein